MRFLLALPAFLLGCPYLLTARCEGAVDSSSPQHTENYAVIVSASRYWFNYRHAANAFSIYQLLKDQGGFTDDNIILMVADDYSMNPRNPVKNTLYNTATDTIDVVPGKYSNNNNKATTSIVTPDTMVDYRSEDVTVENFIRVLTGRSGGGKGPVLPSGKQMRNAHVLLYLTGHGGEEFFKFQDVEEITAQEIADAIGQMEFRHLLLVADTCQAFTLGAKLTTAANVTVIGSSLKGQSSYAHGPQPVLGLAVIEKYTHYFVQRAKQLQWTKDVTIRKAMVDGYPKARLGGAEIGLQEGTPRSSQMPLSDFFRNVAAVGDSQKPVTIPTLQVVSNRTNRSSLYRQLVSSKSRTIHTIGADDLSCLGTENMTSHNEDESDSIIEPSGKRFVALVGFVLVSVGLMSQWW